MKRSILTARWVVATLVLGSAIGSWTTPSAEGQVCLWSNSVAYPINVLDQASVTQGGFLYCFAGVSENGVIADSFRFDGTTWTAIAPVPAAVEFPAAVSDGTFMYILGGASNTGVAQTTMYRYDPVSNTYATMAPFSVGTWNQTAVYLDGKIYKFCGSTDAGSTGALEIYDIGANSWSLGASYPLAVSFVGAFADSGFIYAAGGIEGATGIASQKTYLYDPVFNAWDDASIADLPDGRWGAASSGSLFGPGASAGWVLAGGYVGIGGPGTISATAVIWSPITNSWSSLNDMPGDRARMTGAQYNGNFYVIGGRSAASAGFVGEDSNQQLTCLENMALITSGPVSIVSEDCVPPNGAPDPGEGLTVDLPLMNGGDISTTNLTATLQATGGVVNPSGAVNYGAVAPDNMPVSGIFSFTADPNAACGDSITLTWTITDGIENYPDVTATYSTGARTISLEDNMDGVMAPALPGGWSSVQTSGSDITWATTETSPSSAPNAAFASDPPSVNAAALTSPPVMIGSADSQLAFSNFYNTEATYDGGVLEYSTDGATWTDVIDGGGSFVSGGYNATISVNFSSPIAGRMAWAGNSGGYVDTVVNLPASLNGQMVSFRWLMATDSSVSSTGWWVDNVQVFGGRECSDCGGGVLTVFPDIANTTRGTYISGDANILATSDNMDYVIRRAANDTVARTEFVVEGMSQTTSPTSLEVMLEGAVFARSQVIQSIALYNYVTNAYEEIDSRNATNMVDSTITVAATGDLSRFVDQSTMAVQARVRFQSVNPRQRFSSNTDKFNWMIGN